jgi:hypothetical protein
MFGKFNTFNTIYVHTRVFYGASALFCTPSRHLRDDADVGRRRANDRFAIFWGKCFERWQSETQQSLRRCHDEGPKGTRGNGMGACIRRGFPLCPRCMYTHTHTQYAYNNMYASLFYRTPNTQHPKKERENILCYTPFYQPRARARTKPGFAHRFDAATSLSETRRAREAIWVDSPFLARGRRRRMRSTIIGAKMTRKDSSLRLLPLGSVVARTIAVRPLCRRRRRRVQTMGTRSFARPRIRSERRVYSCDASTVPSMRRS